MIIFNTKQLKRYIISIKINFKKSGTNSAINISFKHLFLIQDSGERKFEIRFIVSFQVFHFFARK